METATLSSKGQVVIPRKVRALAHLVAGDEFTVNYVQGEIRLRLLNRTHSPAIDGVTGCLAKLAHPPMSDQEAEKIAKARLLAQEMATLKKPLPAKQKDSACAVTWRLHEFDKLETFAGGCQALSRCCAAFLIGSSRKTLTNDLQIR